MRAGQGSDGRGQLDMGPEVSYSKAYGLATADHLPARLSGCTGSIFAIFTPPPRPEFGGL